MANFGHIGAFYFGPVDQVVSASIFEVSAVLLYPQISIINSQSATFISPYFPVYVNLLEPIIYTSQDIKVSFIGVPRAGVSPLTVDFTAKVQLDANTRKIYKVEEYRWCFDYNDTNNTCNIPWVITTQNPISHVYTGYSGKKYSVKLCVKLGLI